jgi:predicted DNA-binding transcriptional regulator YafY
MRRRIDPYHIYNYEGDFYCVGYCHKNNGFRDFFIGRITDLDGTDIPFKQREFDLDRYFSDKQWGMMKGGRVEQVAFKIRRNHEQWLIEEFGHKIKLVEQSEDWTVYETEVVVNNDFLNWAVGFNKGIIVLKPESVKNKVVKHLKMLMQEYE